ncbi:sugar ABC transporter permease [Paenibacillus sp. LHD-38]|uniref:carbohydrate ABC transporter permease n=1 Tax=Paenibacillus sp. LHD-38 TaxID=3072143 RepID=UPI00280F9EDD|nr:sugar ABC transporter permease [Paenibacillus sp. LHD-38]MDQ8737145.1 sugar ABC transporter permease [Paenibacillus sp. LHD-38]
MTQHAKFNVRQFGFLLFLMLPAVILLAVTIIGPLLNAISVSFQDYSLLSSEHKWNNFQNYIDILKSEDFYHSFGITLTYVFFAVGLDLLLGLGMALLLNQQIKFRTFFRSIVMIPWAIPTIVTALIFLWIYQPDFGVLNYALKSIGLIENNITWLSSFDFALGAIIAVAVFRQTPLVAVMLLAGMQNISRSLYEAAKIDGSGPFRILTSITIPLLKPVITSVTLMMIVQNFQMFTLFYTLTGGGPADATKSLAILTYEVAFERYDLGKGSAIGVIWLIVLLSFSVLFTRLMNRESHR